MSGSLLVHHWRLEPGLLLVGGGYALCYLVAVSRLKWRWPIWRTAAFLAGIAVVVVATCSGYDTYDDWLLSAHMVQHMLLLLVAPALLLCGHPALLAMRALPARRRPRVASGFVAARRVTGPLACLATFSAAVVLTHLPGFYDATLRHPVLHEGEHLVYLLAGALMWLPILGGDPLPSRRLGGLAMLVYLLATMVPMALVGAYLNRHPTLVYSAYAAPARAAGVSAVSDQAQAGAIMWVGGSMIVIAAGLWAILATMVAEERRLRIREARGGAAGEAW